jgi:hypothetical protein
MSFIMSRLQAWTSNGTPPFIYALTSDLVGLVYNLTSEDAPLRHLLVDAAARFGRVVDFEHFKEDNVYRIEFVKDVLVALAKEKEKNGAQGDEETLVSPPPPPSPPIPHPPGTHIREPPSPQTPSKPPPFFNLGTNLEIRSPRSVLRSVSGSGQRRSSGKHVRFHGDGFAENDCVYHVHRDTGGVCWRVGS